MDLDSLILDCDRFFMMWIPIAVCFKTRDAGNCYLCIAVKYCNPRNWQISDCFSFVRDLHDIGCFVKVIDGCQQLDKETRYMNSNTTGTLFRGGQEGHALPCLFVLNLVKFQKKFSQCLSSRISIFVRNALRVLSVLEFFKSFSEYYKLSTLAGVC